MFPVQVNPVYVLYGSQTGNSECVAKELTQKLLDKHVDAKCQTLNSVKGVSLKETAVCLVIICATTGNGDCPENADAWWRSVKLRSAAKDMFDNVPFAVLGLGDTNYDKFCYMGKVIDKRLQELGGKRFSDMCCADEATELEETIEKWKAGIVSKVLDQLTIARQESMKEINFNPGFCEEKITYDLPPELDEYTDVSICVVDGVACNVMRIGDVAAWMGVNMDLSKPLAASEIPKIKPLKEGSLICPIGYEKSAAASTDASTTSSTTPTVEEWCAEKPFLAEVLQSSWLTNYENPISEGTPGGPAWGESKRVAYVEVSLRGAGISYNPGDSVAVCCPNPKHLVELVFRRVKKTEPDSGLELESTVHLQAHKEDITVEDLLSYRLDLTGTPRKAAVAQLSQYCSDPAEQVQLQYLCSKGAAGKALWSQFLEAQQLGIGELLCLFSSCTPNLEQLVNCCNPLPPRYYSVTTSPLADPNIAGFSFSVVRSSCQITVPHVVDAARKAPVIKRCGLCTTFLEKKLYPWLKPKVAGSMSKTGIMLRVFHKPTLTFHLPNNVSHPLILIGPGTGVSPYIGFLQHRSLLEMERKRAGGEEICCGMWRGGFELNETDLPGESNTVQTFIHSVLPGPIYLFFGCRNEHDFLFRSKIDKYLQDRTLTEFHLAMSRVSSEKVYVMDKIRERGALLTRSLMQDGAFIYICGDGNKMAKDVQCSLREVLAQHGQMTEEQAEAFLQELKYRRRFLLDIWSP